MTFDDLDDSLGSKVVVAALEAERKIFISVTGLLAHVEHTCSVLEADGSTSVVMYIKTKVVQPLEELIEAFKQQRGIPKGT